MCGIVGIIGDFSRDKIVQMADSISHRGPDDVGFFYDQNLALGFRRLSIIDLSMNAHQPMTSKDGKFTIVFNGEIYNYKELREELRVKGHIFKSNSDTEVLLNGFIEWRHLIVEKINGMYAFGIWNKETSELFLARDRFGIKPLYFYHDPESNQFLFSSEIRAFLYSGIIPNKLSKTALFSYLSTGSVKQPLSIIEDVKTLLPGQYMVFSKGKITFKTYWNKRCKQQQFNGKDLINKLDIILKTVIEDQMVSDVPYGLFLSGGIDSSLILSYMSEQKNENVETFSIGFEEGLSKYNEIYISRKTAEIFKSNHHEIIINSKNIIEELDDFINSLDQPSYDGLNSFFVSKNTKKFVTVALSGLGGDEVFLGYNHQIKSYQRKQLFKAISPFKGIIKKTLQMISSNDNIYEKNIINNLRNIFGDDYNLFQNYYNHFFTIFSQYELNYLINDKTIFPPDSEYVNINMMDIILNNDLNEYMRNTLLRDIDAVSMYNSLEVRVPFLDNRVIDFAFELPFEYKYDKHLGGKAILKKLLLKRNNSLSYLLLNKKRGFVFPLEIWLKKYFKQLVYKNLLEEPPPLFNIFNSKYLKLLVDNYYSGQNINYMKIWSLFVLSKWSKLYNLSSN